MYRLTVILLLSLLLTACATHEQSTAAGGAVRSTEAAGLAGKSVLGTVEAGRFNAPALAPVEGLPALPFAEPKGVAELRTEVISGALSFQAGGGAVNAGNSKHLPAIEGAISYSIYRFPGIGVNDHLERLTVNASGGQFSGSAPGYWIGIANFELGRWQTLARAQVASYSQPLLLTSPYLSSEGSVYIFVLTAGQTVNVDSISLRYDDLVDPLWTVVTLEEGNTGWSPSIDLDAFGSPWIAYVMRSDRTPRYAWGLSTENLAVRENWVRGYMVTSAGGGPRLDVDIEATDIVVDPRVNLPVATFSYVDIAGGSNGLNSQAGLASFHLPATGPPLWLYYFVGNGGEYGATMDGADYNSIDFDPLSQRIGVSTSVRNDDESRPARDMYVRYYELNHGTGQPITDIDTYTNFRENASVPELHFPHLRFNPHDVYTQVLTKGNRFFLNQFPSEDWTTWVDNPNTANFGCLAYNEAGNSPLFGVTYARDEGDQRRLYYASYVGEERAGSPEVIDSIAISDGAWIGGSSQLAYTYTGQPVVAYTVQLADGVHVRCTRRIDSQWVVETVSTSPSTATTPQTVLVDVGVEPLEFSTDIPRSNKVWVVWNQVSSSSNSSLKAAQRSLLD